VSIISNDTCNLATFFHFVDVSMVGCHNVHCTNDTFTEVLDTVHRRYLTKLMFNFTIFLNSSFRLVSFQRHYLTSCHSGS
jgi:hypothetical protein